MNDVSLPDKTIFKKQEALPATVFLVNFPELFKHCLMYCPFYFRIKLFVQKHKLQPLVDVLLFAIIIYFFHWLWWSGGLKTSLKEFAFFSEAEQFLAHQVFVPAAWIVENILHYPIKTMDNTIYLANHAYVAIEGACSGLKQFYEWTVLMILFPGPWKKKLWYIPLGIVVIHLDNIIRIVILSVVAVHWPAHWDFIHMWILRPFFYVVIFALWVVWVERVRDEGTERRRTRRRRRRRDEETKRRRDGETKDEGTERRRTRRRRDEGDGETEGRRDGVR